MRAVEAQMELELQIRTIQGVNARLLSDLLAAETYDTSRGLTAGTARSHFTLTTIEQNNKEIERLQKEMVTLSNTKPPKSSVSPQHPLLSSYLICIYWRRSLPSLVAVAVRMPSQYRLLAELHQYHNNLQSQ